MPTIALNVSDETLPRLRQEAAARGFAGPEEYLASLLAEDLRRRDQERLESILVERLESGQSVEMDDADFQRIRDQVAARITQRPNT
jgi:antitoxin ParD1/3/4